MVTMNNPSEYAKASVPSTEATLHALLDSVRGWLESLLALVALEGKKAGIGLGFMIGFGVGATVLSVTGWIALVGCVAAALVENGILGWVWSLFLVAVLNFAGAIGLVFLAIQRRHDLLFSATRHQLGLKSAVRASHE
jgi:uncharacterized membrane protein YqjE